MTGYCEMEPQITCTACGKDFNASMRVCPFCGVEFHPEAPAGTPQCPKCDIDLVTVEFRGTTLDRCSICQGLWLDLSEFSKLTSPRDTFADAEIPFEFSRPPLPP